MKRKPNKPRPESQTHTEPGNGAAEPEGSAFGAGSEQEPGAAGTSGQSVPKSKFRQTSQQEQAAASKLRMEKRGEKREAAREKLAKQKPPKQKGPIRKAAGAAGWSVHGFVHGKLYEVEQENVGTEGAHRSELAILGVHSKKGLVNTMRRMALCAASMLLLGCLAGCSTTPQNSQEQGNPVIKEEISQPLGGSEALGNSEDSSALSAADKEKMFAPYEQYGMTYDAVKDELTYNGNLVRWFEDYYPISNNETAGIDFLNENGTVDVYAVRDLESFSKAADGSVDPAGKLIGLKEFTQQEFDARDIEALKNSTSVAMAGTPLEDSETAKLVAEYETFGVTYDAEKDQWYFNGEEVRYFRDVLTSNGESLTSGKFRGEMRTLGSGVGTIDIYTVRDYGHLNSEHHGTLTGIEKYSQEEFDEHTQAGMSGNQPIGNASHN